MTGDFTLPLPVMLDVEIATSRGLSYGTIYTTKLLRRGTDIDRVPSADPFQDLTAGDAMRRFPAPLATANGPSGLPSVHGRGHPGSAGTGHPPALPAGAVRQRIPHQAVHQLELYSRDGLPVIFDDGQHLQGWHQPERAAGRRPPR